MATRLRLPSTGSAPITPTIQGSYTHTGLEDTHALPAADSSALSSLAKNPDAADHLVAGTALLFVGVSDVLTASQTITGSLANYLAAIQANTDRPTNNLTLRVRVDVVNGGTLKKNLATLTSATNLGLLLDSRGLSATGTATNYTTVAGDRIQVEVYITGTPTAGAGVQGHNATLRIGGDGAGGDLSGSDGDTATDLNPWVELPSTLTFGGGGGGATAVRHQTRNRYRGL